MIYNVIISDLISRFTVWNFLPIPTPSALLSNFWKCIF